MNTLQQARKDKNLSQEDLAAMVGLNPWTIWNIELGRLNPKAITRNRIEAVLGHVDWYSTHKPTKNDLKPTSWHAAEQKLRLALQNIYTLPKDDQNEFLHMAKHYLKVTESNLMKKGVMK